ncbi:costars family protein-like protein [Moniliophthora roreri]|uniref:Uncharacterized protein n=1 Tax=Moniliophthora roreri TaxID=221103 RepID=A0A0W0F781_MONRR|nr:costars family protein-like protein [Moniliophthora roreri]
MKVMMQRKGFSKDAPVHFLTTIITRARLTRLLKLSVETTCQRKNEISKSVAICLAALKVAWTFETEY